MKFEEVIIEDDEFFEDVDWMGIDAFHKYWMDISDPRGKYLQTKADFDFEQAAGSGEWDY